MIAQGHQSNMNQLQQQHPGQRQPDNAPLTAMEQAGKNLDSSITFLSNSLDTLFGRLDAVMGPAVGAQSGKAGTAPRPVTSPLVMQTEDRTAAVQMLIDRISDVMNRLEI